MSFSGMLQELSACLLLFLLCLDFLLHVPEIFRNQTTYNNDGLSYYCSLHGKERKQRVPSAISAVRKGHGKISTSWLNCLCDLV